MIGQPACYVGRHDPAADLSALAKLAEACERFSPLVGWQTVASSVGEEASSAVGLGPMELFLDVTGIGVLFGGEEPLLQAVAEDFARRGYRVKLAIAGSIGAAWALTFGDRRVGQAKIAPAIAAPTHRENSLHSGGSGRGRGAPASAQVR